MKDTATTCRAPRKIDSTVSDSLNPPPAEARGFLAQAARSLSERTRLTLSTPAGTKPARLPVRTKELHVLGSRDARQSAYPAVRKVSRLWGKTPFLAPYRPYRKGSTLHPAEAGSVSGGLR
ncbi:hypothetical protein GCM10027162_77460 [Streptomyces incanus]